MNGVLVSFSQKNKKKKNGKTCAIFFTIWYQLKHQIFTIFTLITNSWCERYTQYISYILSLSLSF